MLGDWENLYVNLNVLRRFLLGKVVGSFLGFRMVSLRITFLRFLETVVFILIEWLIN